MLCTLGRRRRPYCPLLLHFPFTYLLLYALLLYCAVGWENWLASELIIATALQGKTKSMPIAVMCDRTSTSTLGSDDETYDVDVRDGA